MRMFSLRDLWCGLGRSHQRRGFLFVASLAIALLAISPARAQSTYDWNAGTGTWNTTDANWAGAGSTWANGNNAVFANTGAAATITLGEAITAATISVGNGGNNANYTFTGSSLSATSFAVQGNSGNDLSTNPTATIDDANLTLSGDLGVGRVNLVIGGTSTVTADRIGGGGMTGISSADWGLVTIEGSANVTATNGIVGNATAWGLNLNGGTLTTSGIDYGPHSFIGSTNLNFNGTLVKANQNNSDFITVSSGIQPGEPAAPDIQAGGALFDTNGFDIGIGLALAGSGGLTKSGAGTLTLAAANTYAGTTTISAGTLVYQSSYASAAHTIASGAVLAIDVASGTRDSAATTFSGSGTLRKTGAGEILWGGAVGTFALSSGALIDVQGGTFTGGSNANENWSSNESDLHVAAGAVFRTVEANVRVDGISGSGTIATGYTGAGYQNLTIGVANGSSQFDGVIADDQAAGSLVKQGSGTITLAGNNTYSGGTIFEGGIANAATFADYGSNSSLGNRAESADAGGDVGLLFRGGTLQYTGSTPQSTNRSIRLSTTGGGGTIDASGSDPSATLSFTATSSTNFFENPGDRTLTLTGSNTGENSFAMEIAEAGGATAVVKSGAGRWVLTGANSYSGGTAISGGTLQVGDGGTSGSLGSGGVTNNASLVFNRSDNVVIANGISGSGSLTQAGSGRVELTAVNNYSGGTTVNAGTLVLPGNGGQGRISGALTVNSGGVVETTGDGTGLGFVDQLTALTINGGTVRTDGGTSHIWNITSGVTMTGGEMQSNGGVSSPTGPALQWNRTNLSTNASVNSAVVSGRVNLRADSGYSNWAVSVADGAAATDLLVSAAITQENGSVGITKSGSGTMLLSGTNSYTGATSVTGGTLAVNGTLGNTAVTVASGATLGGSGSLAGATTIQSGGFLSPGNSPGVITLGSLTLDSGSTTLIEIAGTTRGTQYDGVDISGLSGLTYGGALALDFTSLLSPVADGTTFNIFEFTGTPSSSFSSVSSTGTLYAGTWTDLGAGAFELNSGGQTLTFAPSTGDISVVPEPGSMALAALGLAAAGWVAARRRHQQMHP